MLLLPHFPHAQELCNLASHMWPDLTQMRNIVWVWGWVWARARKCRLVTSRCLHENSIKIGNCFLRSGSGGCCRNWQKLLTEVRKSHGSCFGQRQRQQPQLPTQHPLNLHPPLKIVWLFVCIFFISDQEIPMKTFKLRLGLGLPPNSQPEVS